MYFHDLTGQRFGRLVVISHEGSDKFHNALWRCRCDCGNEVIVKSNSLRYGDTRSCGCLHSENLVGQRFGRLLVVERLKERSPRRNVRYRCLCDCGNEVTVISSDLKSGHTRSCGCLMHDTVRTTSITHGESKSRLYVVWKGMKNRCDNPSHVSYKNYGGRGIVVCPEWGESFEAFSEWAYANGYDDMAKRVECTIDRINVNGNYCPENCRWVDQKTQCNNKRLKGAK